jgi:hypothetical protein
VIDDLVALREFHLLDIPGVGQTEHLDVVVANGCVQLLKFIPRDFLHVNITVTINLDLEEDLLTLLSNVEPSDHTVEQFEVGHDDLQGNDHGRCGVLS